MENFIFSRTKLQLGFRAYVDNKRFCNRTSMLYAEYEMKAKRENYEYGKLP